MRFKKLIPFFCVLLLFSMLSSTALAYEPDTPVDDPDDPVPYTYISSIFVSFDISNSGLSDDYCRVYIPDSSCSCWLDMYLERWNSSTSQWDVVKSWSKNGSGTITLEKEWYVTYGYAYQLRNEIYVYNSNGLLVETEEALSIIVPFGGNYP